MVSSSIRLTAWLQNSKKRGGQRDWCMSKSTDYLRSGYLHRLSWAVNHYRDNAITYKAQRGKMQENWSWRTRQYWHADASAWCCCARCKIHEGVITDAKAENDALRDDVAAGRRRLHQNSLSVSAWSHHRLRRGPCSLPPTGRHRWTGLFHPQRGWSLCKNNWKEPRSILMSSADRVAHRWATRTIIVSNTHALPAEYKYLVIKPEQSIYECLLGFCFNNIFCAATNFGCIDSFLLPNSRNEEMMGDGFPLVLLLPVCFEQ